MKKAEQRMKELENDNEKLNRQRDFMRGLLEEIRNDHDIYLDSYDGRLKSTKYDLNVEKVKREDSEQEILKSKRILEKLQEDLRKLQLQQRITDVERGFADQLLKGEEKMEEDDEISKHKIQEMLETKLKELIDAMEADPNYVELVKANNELTAKISSLEKDLDNWNYKILETDKLMDLSKKMREASIDERKRLQSELDKMKNLMDETNKLNKLKIDKRFRETESEEIRKRKAILAKLEKEVQEVKYKCDKLIPPYTELLKEIKVKFGRHFEKLRRDNGKLANKVHVIAENIETLKPDSMKLSSILEELRASLTEKNDTKEELWIKRKDLEMTTIGLDLYSKFLGESVNLDEYLRSINFENLKNWVQTNQNVGETVKEFMDTFQEIKKFSKPA